MDSPYVTVYAPTHLDPTDSYGLIACELVRHLNRMQKNTNVMALGNHLHPNQDEEIRSLANKPIIPTRGGILLGYPTTYAAYGELANLSPKIAVTMFESTLVPEEWIPILNKMDAIVTPSFFCSEAFKRTGVTVPIFILPLGVSEVYKFKKRSLDAPFTFLTFLDRGKRKGGLKTLEAFVQEFGDDPRVKLIFKHKEDTGKRPKLVSDDPNIEYIYGDYTSEQLFDLYTQCHCLVNPHKGEGFGLIPREFAATGGISLTTDWSGTRDLLALWGWGIEADLEVADWIGIKNLQGKNLGQWADPKISHVRSLMRDVFNRQGYYLHKAIAKSEFARRIYTWEFFAKSVYALWEAIANGYGIRSEKITA